MHIQRRFNYTGRKRINKSDVEIRLFSDETGNGWFTVAIDFSKLNLPPKSNVIIEARQRDLLQRFECGTVGAFRLPEKALLTEVDPLGQLSFWVRVLDPGRRDGRLLAVARSIHPIADGRDGKGRDSLLPVRSKDLGQLPWRIEFPLDESGVPWLVVNNKVPGAIEKMQSDGTFQSLVFPAAVREILMRIYLDFEGWSEDSWALKWLEFGRRLVDEDWPKLNEAEEAGSWIDRVVTEFCVAFSLSDRLVKHLGGEDK